ncbi:hypothetical protein BDN72DRAFT_675058 [Pluteus cervinus]|uniref:Uncharacterized protein n=1 Tax=Pluteus cervinus TaxID=181527 RepID=A0ACD3ARV6_9AGAR|nr:hypothetical protein BDN72DRAFT_675058 [Pluteus cervinus]
MDEPGTSHLSITGSPASTRQCSVRACNNVLVPGEANKMCEVCRGRHRIYATTKRAKRKLEKAAMVGQSVFSMDPLSSGTGVWIDQDVNMDVNDGQVDGEGTNQQNFASVSEPTSQPLPTDSASVQSPPWDGAIDPRLFQSSLLQSSSSELAGALSYSIPSSSTDPSLVGVGTPFEHTLDESAVSQIQNAPAVMDPAALMDPIPSSSLLGDPMENQESTSSSTQMQASQVGATEQEPLLGATRVCSVRGCKTIMQAHYQYKMCEPCRGRYRKYGTTKRAKWKAERAAFDRELSELRKIEDARREKEGLAPLSESAEELRKWELSIIDEQVPLPATVSELLEATMKSTGLTDISAAASLILSTRGDGVATGQGVSLDGSMNTAAEPTLEAILNGTPASLAELQRKSGNTTPIRVMQPTGIDTRYSVSPYTSTPTLELLANDVSQTAFIPPFEPSNQSTPTETLPFTLPARMCTVSHCHKILPGFYRYKRCEQHRLQNRYHSQLKRVREKVVKNFKRGDAHEEEEEEEEETNDESAEFVSAAQTGPASSSSKISCNVNGSSEASSGPVVPRPSRGAKSTNTRSKEKKSLSVCAAEGCHNFMSREVRWRTCDGCRAELRQKRKMATDAPEPETSHEDGTLSGEPKFIIMTDLKDIEEVTASEESELTTTTSARAGSVVEAFSQDSDQETITNELAISMDVDDGAGVSSPPLAPSSSLSSAGAPPPSKPLTFRSYTAGSLSSAIERVVAQDSNTSTERAFNDVWKVARTLVDGEKENAKVTSSNQDRSSSIASVPAALNSTKSVRIRREKNAVAGPSGTQETISNPPSTVDQARPAPPQVPPYSYSPSIHTSIPYPYYMPYLYPPYPYPTSGAPPSTSRPYEPPNHFYPFTVPGPYPYHPYAAIPPTGYSYLPPRYIPGVHDSAYAPQSSSNIYQHTSFIPAQAPTPPEVGKPNRNSAITQTRDQTQADGIETHSPPLSLPRSTDTSDYAEIRQGVQPPESSRPSEERSEAIIGPQRPCSNRACKRKVPSEGPTVLCPRCVLRFKKHQAKTKVRLKLEPKRLRNAGRGLKSSD